MSEREQFVNQLVEKIKAIREWTAPYGILTGLHSNALAHQKAAGKYRSITFGVARYLDAEVRVYSKTYITADFHGPLARFESHQLFKSETELLDFLRLHFS